MTLLVLHPECRLIAKARYAHSPLDLRHSDQSASGRPSIIFMSKNRSYDAIKLT
jgi:hypothetical protein